MDVKIKKLDPQARLPRYATDGSGAFDIFPMVNLSSVPQVVTVGLPLVFKTGLAFEIPENHVMLIFSRSGQGFKSDMRLANCVGVIDSDYRGELMVKLTKDVGPDVSAVVNEGEAIAQGMIIKLDRINFIEVENLSPTDRGINGFGSTTKV